ncbi:SSI family serine proteinase inhibitor [Actinomadura kijaniata]|uniref:SSI family serine proteinase inhibitor n=1 Tax=Actinomadura kijaniata TaxID=46161 RepID=UPI000A5CA7D9|nr:SSI family serine proteinase inhibitor [Actinomadura kijaniata]
MRVPALSGATALLTAALIPAVLIPATALPTDAVLGPPTAEFDLTVADAAGTPLRGALLTCPDGLGNHPHGEETCAVLESVGGDLDRLPGDPHSCARGHAPVTATATGVRQGVPVWWSRTFANACEMDARTGPVFRFWG